MGNSHKLRNITRKDLEPVWNRHDIPTQKIAEALGVTRAGLSYKAKSLGLPSRAGNQLPHAKATDDELREMWEAGVCSTDIAKHFGYSHRAAVSRRVKMIGLNPRTRSANGASSTGWRETISLAEYKQMKLAEAMKADARTART